MRKRPTKAEIRAELEAQVQSYLEKGGDLLSVANGVSGRDNPDGPLKPNHLSFDEPKEGRTLVPEVLAAIDSRRRPVQKPKHVPKRPKKKMIYDDFGEPLRWEWVEE